MKLLVETVGPTMLMDLGGNQTVPSHRPAVVTKSPLIASRITDQTLEVISQVNDEATDLEFQSYWTDSEDRDLAIESFQSAYPIEASAPKQAPKKPEVPRRGKAKP